MGGILRKTQRKIVRAEASVASGGEGALGLAFGSVGSQLGLLYLALPSTRHTLTPLHPRVYPSDKLVHFLKKWAKLLKLRFLGFDSLYKTAWF